MLNKLRKFWGESRTLVLYLIFGVLTTVVSFGVSVPLHYFLGLSAALSDSLSWVISVLFAFFANKQFVFSDTVWSRNVVWPELIKFVSGRLASFGFECVFLLLFVDIIGADFIWMKVVASIFVVLINYFIGKNFVFVKKNPDSE